MSAVHLARVDAQARRLDCCGEEPKNLSLSKPFVLPCSVVNILDLCPDNRMISEKLRRLPPIGKPKAFIHDGRCHAFLHFAGGSRSLISEPRHRPFGGRSQPLRMRMWR